MMEEIKFRGMDIKGNWYYGNLSILKQNVDHVKAGSYISNKVGLPFAYQVRPETVGQFTGLYDRNGKEIYEGDIVNTTVKNPEIPERIQAVVVDPECPGNLCFEPRTGASLVKANQKNFEIIGNIHESPGLMK